MSKFDEVYKKIITEMNEQVSEGKDLNEVKEKRLTAEQIKNRIAKLFGVDPDDERFIEWSEALGDNYELNNRIDELFDSGEFNDTKDPEYEAAWTATNELSDEELLKSFEDYKDRTYEE